MLTGVSSLGPYALLPTATVRGLPGVLCTVRQMEKEHGGMSGMAEVLARRNFEDEQGKGEWDHIGKSEKRGWLKEAQSTLDFLTAAGFGDVTEAKAEAWEEGRRYGVAFRWGRTGLATYEEDNPYCAVRGEG